MNKNKFNISLVKHPDQNLWTPCTPVEIDKNLLAWIEAADKFIKQIDDEHRAVGIRVAGMAAPQLGLNKRLFTALGKWYINPEITWRPKGGKSLMKEGCFSLPRFTGYPVWRDYSISIKYQNIDGVWIQEDKVKGFLAQVLQHEYDHLEGVMCCGKVATNPEIYAETESPEERPMIEE